MPPDHIRPPTLLSTSTSTSAKRPRTSPSFHREAKRPPSHRRRPPRASGGRPNPHVTIRHPRTVCVGKSSFLRGFSEVERGRVRRRGLKTHANLYHESRFTGLATEVTKRSRPARAAGPVQQNRTPNLGRSGRAVVKPVVRAHHGESGHTEPAGGKRHTEAKPIGLVRVRILAKWMQHEEFGDP